MPDARAMMKMRFLCKLVCLGAVSLMTACANQPSTFTAAPEQAELGSVVYIYRPASSSNFLYSPRVIVDDDEKFSIANGDYRYIYLPAGEHVISLNPTDQYTTGAATMLTVEADARYYLRVNTLLKFEPDSMNTRKFWIDVVDEDTAVGEIARTEYAGPESPQSAAVRSGADDNQQGFSVDKTRDPFAGKYE